MRISPKIDRDIMYFHQRTLKEPVSCSGVGLHSGKKVRLTIKPAPENHGIKFYRTDLLDSPAIHAHFNMVVDTSLATVIGSNGCIVSTIEHLMASFAGLSIDNARVELNDYEVPVMDGSAGPFTEMITATGIVDQRAPRHFFIIKQPIELVDGDKSVCIKPDNVFKVSANIAFDNSMINQQSFSDVITDRIFIDKICRARTFGFLQEVEYLKRYGLARGGSLDNAVVIDKDRIVNQDGLRYPDEFVRHKVLDCLGDFSLLGLPVIGHLRANKSGHALNHAFLEKFFSEKDSWETASVQSPQDLAAIQSKYIAL